MEKLLELKQEKFELVKTILNVPQRGLNQFTGIDILNFVSLTPEEIELAKTLFYIPERGKQQFNGDDIINLVKLTPEQYEVAKTLFYIPQRSAQQFYGNELVVLATLDPKQYEVAKTLLYLPEKGNNQFDGFEITRLCTLSPEKLEKAKSLYFIPARGKNQFDAESIVNLLKLDNKQFELAKNLFYIPERGDNQFNGCEIANLMKLDLEKYNKIKSLLYLPERGNEQFNSDEILKLLELKEEEFEVAKTLFSIKENGENLLVGGEIAHLAKLDAKKLEEAKSLLKLPFSKEYSLWFRAIFDLTIQDDSNFKMFMDLVNNKDVVSLENANSIVLDQDIKDKYTNLLKNGFTSKNASVMANMNLISEYDNKDINELLNLLKIENNFGINISDNLDKYFTKNPRLNLKEFINYIKSVNIEKLEKIAPNVKNYSLMQRLHFFDYHYKLGTTDFSRENMTFNKDLTSFLMNNYMNAQQLTDLLYRYPNTSREVGQMPDGWLDKIPKYKHKKVKKEIYTAIDDFQNNKNIENFTKRISDILRKKVSVSHIDSGAYGSGYKISIENSKDVCLKVFYKNFYRTIDGLTKHGANIEVQTGLFVNQHSNDFVKMYFGKVAPLEFNDGFLVTEFLSEDITPSDTQKIDSGYIITSDDAYGERNMINNKIFDYGGVTVKKYPPSPHTHLADIE